jgi:hypothetical protein
MMSADAQVETILLQFPGPVTLYRSRRKWLLVLLGCLVFTAAGIGMVADNNDPWGWFTLIFFGLGSVIAARSLLPGAGALTLEQNGFVIRNLFHSYRVPWQDAAEFEAVEIPPSMLKMVVFDQQSTVNRTLSKLNVAIAGHNGSLPDTYGLSADTLARLMTLWRERALAPDQR